MEHRAKNIINNSKLTEQQKILINGYIDRVLTIQEEYSADRKLIEEVADVNNISEIILSTNEVKIYSVIGKDVADKTYPFRSIYLDSNGTWCRVNIISETFDIAYLNYLQYKYLDVNSRFTDFAIKMLEIKI